MELAVSRRGKLLPSTPLAFLNFSSFCVEWSEGNHLFLDFEMPLMQGQIEPGRRIPGSFSMSLEESEDRWFG